MSRSSPVLFASADSGCLAYLFNASSVFIFISSHFLAHNVAHEWHTYSLSPFPIHFMGTRQTWVAWNERKRSFCDDQWNFRNAACHKVIFLSPHKMWKVPTICQKQQRQQNFLTNAEMLWRAWNPRSEGKSTKEDARANNNWIQLASWQRMQWIVSRKRTQMPERIWSVLGTKITTTSYCRCMVCVGSKVTQSHSTFRSTH